MLRIFPLADGTFEVHAKASHSYVPPAGEASDACVECKQPLGCHDTITKTYAGLQLRSVGHVAFDRLGIAQELYLQIEQPCKVTETRVGETTLALVEGQ